MNERYTALVRQAIFHVLDEGRKGGTIPGVSLGWRFDDLNGDIANADRVDFADQVVAWLPVHQLERERVQDVNALMEDIRKGDDMLMAWFKASSPYATPGSLEEGLRKRALLSTDCYCPYCGHNRCKSSVSSIDNDDGTHYCQKCSAEWREIP